MNPLAKVKKDSSIGKSLGLSQDITPGVNNPFWKDADGNQAQLKAAVTQALVQEKERTNTLSWMLASTVASEEVQVDPATLATLMESAQNGGVEMTPETVEKYLNTPEFRKKWEQISIELQRELTRLKDPALLKQIEKVSPEDLSRLYGIAKQTAKKIQSRSGTGKIIANLKDKWLQFTASALPGISNFGVAENEFLKNAEPSNFVVDQFWKQFLIDYSLAIVQMGAIGARANLADPQALAANEGGILWTNPGHFADMFAQVRIYGIMVPSSLALVYQKAAEITDQSYVPLEDQSLLGAVNLVQADYGAIWVKRLVKSLKTIQAGYLMTIAERVVVGGQGFADANCAFLYSMVWATWQFGWMWEPITRGNNIYQSHLEENALTFTEIKSALGTAIRLDDQEQIKTQMNALTKLYENSSVDLPQELSGSIDQMFQQLENANPVQVSELNFNFNQSREQISELRSAIVEGNSVRIEASQKQLLSAYQSGGADTESLALLMKLNSVSLLDFAMKNPPFAVKPHKGVEWFSTLLGALATTYYATSLSVDTFRQNVSWGEKITHAALLSAGLYAGAFYFPRVWKKAASLITEAKENVCNFILSVRSPQKLK